MARWIALSISRMSAALTAPARGPRIRNDLSSVVTCSHHGSFPQASFASRELYMRRGRAQRGRQRHHNHIVRQAVPDVHGNDQGRPGLGIGRVPGERDQVDVTTARIGHGAYSSQNRLAPSAAMADHSLSSSCSAGERER